MHYIKGSINVKKLDKKFFREGKDGALYFDFILWENRNGPDKFGNHYSAKQGIPKEEAAKRKANGIKDPFIGNAKAYGERTPDAPKAYDDNQPYYSDNKPTASGPEPEDVPF